MSDRDAQIEKFHSDALLLIVAHGDATPTRDIIKTKLIELAAIPDILPDLALDRLHTTGTSATILHQGADGIGALMLLKLPPDQPTPVHNHNTWGISCVVVGRNRYWSWERLDDGSDPDTAELQIAEVLDQGPGDASIWSDPPQDWHAQQGLGGDAFELVFFGRNPLLKPRAYYDPATRSVTYAFASDGMN